MDKFWCHQGVPYPPLGIWASWLATAVTGSHPWFGVIAQRGIALIGWGLLAGSLPVIAKRVGIDPKWAGWFGLLNPFVVIHGIGGAHNDLAMAGLAVAGIAVAGCTWPRFVGGSVLVGLAMAMKPQAGLATVAVAGATVVSLSTQVYSRALVAMLWRTATSVTIAVATFVAVSLATGLGFGWVSALSQSSNALTPSPYFIANDILNHLRKSLLMNPVAHSKKLMILMVLVAALAFIWLFLTRIRQPLRIVAWGSLLVVLVNKVLLMWYFVLPAVLLALVPIRRRTIRWLYAGSCAYLVTYMAYFMFGWKMWHLWVDVIAGAMVGVGVLWATANSRGLVAAQRPQGTSSGHKESAKPRPALTI